MQLGLTATSQTTSAFTWRITAQTVTLCFAAPRAGKHPPPPTAETCSIWSSCLLEHKLMILYGETVFLRCGGMEGAVEQASRPCKAKGMPGWIRIRQGWERGEKVREGPLGLSAPGAGGTGRGATSFRRPGVHRVTWSNVQFWHTQTSRFLLRNTIQKLHRTQASPDGLLLTEEVSKMKLWKHYGAEKR